MTRSLSLLVAGTVIACAASGHAALTGSWQPLGPERGRINVLTVQPGTPLTLYAGTDGGVLRSVDGGASWAGIDGGLEGVYAVRAVAVDPRTPTTLYVAGGGGVFKSTNGGATWQRASTGFVPNRIGIDALVIDPITPTILYAVQGGIVFRSTDGAATWSERSAGASRVSHLVINPRQPFVLYAGTMAGFASVHQTTNSGRTWIARNTGLPNDVVSALAIDPVNVATLYVAECVERLFKTTTSGFRWLPAASGFSPGYCLDTLLVDPQNPNTVYAGDRVRGVFRSSNGGASWAPTALTATPITTLAIDAVNGRLYAGSDGPGVFRSTDGGASWSEANTGLAAHDVQAVAVDPGDPLGIVIGVRGGGVFRSLDGGASWLDGSAGLTDLDIRHLAFDDEEPLPNLFAATFGAGIFRSTDRAASWLSSSDGLPAGQGWVVAIAPTDRAILYAGAASGDVGVHKSLSGGGLWAPSSNGLATPASRSIAAIAIDPTTAMTVYAGTNGDGVHKSVDGGGSWSPSSAGLSSLQVNALAIDPSTPMTLYAGTAAGLHHSTDGGASWSLRDQGMPPATDVTAVVIDPRRPATLYASTPGEGVFRSLDAGATWAPLNTGLPTLAVPVIVLDGPGATTLYGGTRGRSLFALQAVCGTAADCDDGDGCTVDLCDRNDPQADPSGCFHTPLACPAPDRCHQSGTCSEGACRYPNRPDGTRCADDDACTTDTCRAGVCVSTLTPEPSCRAPRFRRASALFMNGASDDPGSRLLWRWYKGPLGSLDDYGDPTADTEYALCVYDQSGAGGDPALVLRAAIPPGRGRCGNDACWTSSSSGFRYRSGLREPDGIERVLLRVGAQGAAKILVAGRGENLPLPGRALSPPVTVQLRRRDTPDTCWQAEFSDFVSQNDGGAFRGLGGPPEPAP